MKSPKHVMRNAQTLVVEALVRNPAGQKAFKCAAKRPPPSLLARKGGTFKQLVHLSVETHDRHGFIMYRAIQVFRNLD